MAEQLTVRAVVEVLLKGGNLPTELRNDLEKLRDQSVRAAGGVGTLDKAMSQLRRQITGFIGGAALARFAQTSLTEFAKLERGFNALAFQLDNLGLSSGSNLPRIKATLQAIQDGGGALKTETLPIFQRLVGITKNVNEALALTKLAADAGESGFIETGAAAEALSQILQGRARGAAQALGIEFFKLNGVAKTNGELMAEAIERFSGLGDASDDTQNKLEKLAGAWSDLKQRVGEGVAAVAGPAVTAFNTATKAIQTFGAVTGHQIDNVIIALKGFADVAAKALDIKSLVTNPQAYLDNVSNAILKIRRDVQLGTEATAEEIANIWKKTGKDSGEGFKKGLEDAVAQANRAQARAEQVAALESAVKIAQARVDAARKGSQEELDARLALIDAQFAAEIEKNKQAGQSIAGLEQARLAERAAILKQFNDARIEAELEADKRLADVRAAGVRKGSEAELQARLDAINRAYATEIQKANQSTAVLKNLELARLEAIAQERERFQEEAIQRELSQEAELLQAKIAQEEQAISLRQGNEQQHLDELGRLQQELLDVQMRSEVEGADETGKQVQKIWETYELLIAAAALAINQRKLDSKVAQEINSMQLAVEGTQENSLDRYKAEKALIEAQYDQRIKNEAKTTKDQVNLNRAKENAVRELQIRTVANQISLYASAASQINGMLIKAFGEHKAFAIAQAIIDTAGAIANALNSGIPPPGNIALAAVVGALGAVQIAKIASTNIGSTGAPASPGGASVSATGGSGGRKRRPEGERPIQTQASTSDRFAGSTTRAASDALRREAERRERRREREAQPTTVINNDNRQTSYAPTVRLEGVVATTKTDVYKHLRRGLDRADRTVIRRSRVNG